MANTWKQTVDGQWQLFSDYKPPTGSSEGIYKPSALTSGDSKVAECSEKPELSVSMPVWTPQGYGTIK